MVDAGSQLTCNFGKTEIEVTYTTSTDLREADENVVRKDFSVEEIAEIAGRRFQTSLTVAHQDG